MSGDVTCKRGCDHFEGVYYWIATCEVCGFKSERRTRKGSALAEVKAHYCPKRPTRWRINHSPGVLD